MNPNFPVLDYAISWPAGPNQSPVQPYWCSMLERTEGKVKFRRGKQYELDQVQPGELTGVLRNFDGALDPDNTSSPYNGHVIPYRLFRMRAQWSPTVNLLTQNQATAGEATLLPYPVEQPWGTGLTTDTVNLQAGSAGMPTIVADGTAFQGANVFSSTVPASSTFSFSLFGQRGMTCFPGQQITASVYARVSTASITSTALLQIQWVDASGAFISGVNGPTVSLASGPTSAWTRLTNTATAPANAAGMLILPSVVTGPATSFVVQTDGWQYEKAAVASAFVVPGVWYPSFTGYVERWPQRYRNKGTYAYVPITVVDYFAFLSQRALLAPFKADLLTLAPNFLYALDEAAGTLAFADASGKNSPLPVLVIGTNTPQVTEGNSVQASGINPQAGDLSNAFLGTPGPVLTTNNPLTQVGNGNGNYINLAARGATPGPPSAGPWTRVIAFRCTTAITGTGNATVVWSSLAAGTKSTDTPQQGFVIQTQYVSGSGASSVYRVGASTVVPAGSAQINSTAPINPLDGNWHLAAFTLQADQKTLTIRVDSYQNSTTFGVSVAPNVGPGGSDAIGGFFYPGDLIATQGWAGDIALACEFPTALTDPQWTALYRSWRNAWAANATDIETSDSRYARILGWAGYTGPTRLSSGASVKYGPATDITGLAVLQALQGCVDTEGGQHFVAADGTPTFQSRADRYNKVATVTFGENTAGGEIPYEDFGSDNDPTRIANDIQVSATYGNALYRSQDGPQTDPTKSQGKFGTITLQRNINSIDSAELTAASQYYLYRYKDPRTRLESLPVNPSSYPAGWAAVLGVELGTCAKATRRPPAPATQINVTGFVEQIEWEIDGDANTGKVAFQISNSAKQFFGKFDDATFGLFDSTLIFGY